MQIELQRANVSRTKFEDYLWKIAEKNGFDAEIVIGLADILGLEERFDGQTLRIDD
jgi:hypothetical protein